jgi:SAM-dependent methyltransferase
MRAAFAIVRRLLAGPPQFRAFVATAIDTWDARIAGECPCCGYTGLFQLEPHMGLAESCPRCHALERHRLLALAMRAGAVSFAGARVLHFAPDPIVERLIEGHKPAAQLTVDYTPGRASEVQNIEALTFPDGAFERILCSHVLEHVDDAKALRELFRVLVPGGEAVLMLPVVEGWATSYEDPAITDEAGRTAHFQQWDHVRIFGADIRRRIAAAGFTLAEYTAGGAEAVRYRLLRGEKVFIARRPLD